MSTQQDISVSLHGVDVGDRLRVLASVKPNEGTKRTPVDICCVVDVSGSMSTTATFQNEKGETESHGLTILDIVKHAVETIIHTLDEGDRLSIVTYSTTAAVVTELTTMNEDGRTLSSEKLKELRPQATTNLWDGLLKGMEVLRKVQSDNRLGAIFILTDGMPNVEPPSGHIPMLRKYKDQNKLECTISSFGFGYSMDSPLLYDIAIEGDGMYAFIPDSGFVGTTFVNALSNLLVTEARQVTLNVETSSGYKIIAPETESSAFTVASWGAAISLSTLHYGQPRHFVFELEKTNEATESSPILTATVNYKSCSGIPGSCEAELTSISDTVPLDMEQEYLRQELSTAIMKLIGKDLQTATKTVEGFLTKGKASQYASDEFIFALLEDAKGQVTEAVSCDEYYNKWGKHYLPSLARAHWLQQCNNFKDPGIQFYGGELFNNIRDVGDDIFISLPPPEPSGNSYDSYGGYGGYGSSSSFASSYQAPTSMSAYYCSSNPCFSGDSLVKMANGLLKRCDKIQKGDLVLTGNGNITAVRCVVRTECAGGKADLVTLEGGLKITEYHPVRMDGKWHFPCDIHPARNMNCPYVFSYVLENHHTMNINGVECVSLGHSFTEETVAHPYFGSQLIIKDLQRMSGWEQGLVTFAPGCMLKDTKTDLVCAFSSAHAYPIPV